MRGCLTTFALTLGLLAFAVPRLFTAPMPSNPTGDYWVGCNAALPTVFGADLTGSDGEVLAETKGPDIAVPIASAAANAACRDAAWPRIALGVALFAAVGGAAIWSARRLEPHILDPE